MIYFMRAGPDGPVKIGWTKDEATLKRRKVTLQTGQPFRLEVLRTLDTPRWTEAWLHGFFNGLRTAGEWFHYDPQMMELTPPEDPEGNFGTDLTPPIHIRLSREDLDVLKARAKEEKRPTAAMARLLLQRALQAKREAA